MASDPPQLDVLLAALTEAEVRGDARTPVAALAYRSADAVPGTLFFAVPGTQRDGHAFAGEAVSRGATAVVVERALELPETVIQVLVPSVRAAMGPIASGFYGRPSERLKLVGVTGTNGKTTTTYILEAIFREAGLVPGLIGTTGVRVAGRPLPLDRTTPEAPDLHRMLAEMLAEGVGAVAMEVSSHGLDQHRVGGVRFASAVFTNLSQDHLDYHETLDAYFEAKARLFTSAMTAGAVVNIDDERGRSLVRGDLPTVTFGLSPEAEVRATNVETRADGVAFSVGDLRVRSALRGRFNVYNTLGAFAAARQVGIADDAAVRGIAAIEGVPGRLEPVENDHGFEVLVDYAHTPASVESVLREARHLASARVIVVLGCGGDRDRGKRPLMGEAATRLADLSVITSDNPRSEDPGEILEQVVPGAERGGGRFIVEPDRRVAIRLALAEAKPGDVVVIAGKGHETGQEFADRTIPFDDRIVAREELEALS